MSFGFSPSDVVTFTQFATKIWRALREEGGSKVDYQIAERQCRSFLDIIQEVQELKLPALPTHIQIRIKNNADDAYNLISTFKDVIKKYEKSLAVHSRRGALTSAPAKIRWAFAAAEDLVSFRESLACQLDLIKLTMMMSDIRKRYGPQSLQTIQSSTQGVIGEDVTSLTESQPALSSAEDQPTGDSPTEDAQDEPVELHLSTVTLDPNSVAQEQQLIVKHSMETIRSQHLEEVATKGTEMHISTRSALQLKAIRDISKLLSRDLSSRLDWRYGLVYILEEEDSAFVKIGITSCADFGRIKTHMNRCEIRIQGVYVTAAFRGCCRAKAILFKLLEEDEFPYYGGAGLSSPRAGARSCSHRGWFRKSFKEAKMIVDLVCDWMHFQAPYFPTMGDNLSDEQPRDWHASLDPVWADYLKLWMKTQYTPAPLEWKDFFQRDNLSWKATHSCRSHHS